jgi:hypothetical protein
MEKEKQKRLVPLWQYLWLRLKKNTLSSTGAVFERLGCIGGIVLAIVAFVNFPRLFLEVWKGDKDSRTAFATFLLTTILFGLFYKLGRMNLEDAEKITPVEPLTNENIAKVPTEEILVRAASEPTEGQENVLLRPTQSADDTPPDQLLRSGS